MRLTTVATIGVLLLGGWGPASATRGRRVAIHHEKTVLRHAGGGARHKGGSVHDTQAAGAAERGSDAAAEGQSGTIGTGDGGSVLAQHTTTGCALTAYAPTYTTHRITAKPSGSRNEISDYIRLSIRNSPHRH